MRVPRVQDAASEYDNATERRWRRDEEDKNDRGDSIRLRANVTQQTCNTTPLRYPTFPGTLGPLGSCGRHYDDHEYIDAVSNECGDTEGK